jgi:hypothetical protein
VFGLTDDPRSRDRARQFFLDPTSRTFFPDWGTDAESVTAELRVQAARHPDDEWLAALIRELRAKSAEFRALWADHSVREKTQGLKRIDHPIVGELVVTYGRLTLADDDEQALIAYTAEPGSPTAERLSVLASWGMRRHPGRDRVRQVGDAFVVHMDREAALRATLGILARNVE